MQVTKSRSAVVFSPVGGNVGASFLGQSQSEVRQNQITSLALLFTLMENCSSLMF